MGAINLGRNETTRKAFERICEITCTQCVLCMYTNKQESEQCECADNIRALARLAVALREEYTFTKTVGKLVKSQIKEYE